VSKAGRKQGKRKQRQAAPTPSQAVAALGIRALAASHPDDLEVVGDDTLDDGGVYVMTLRLATGRMPHADGGLRLRDWEQVKVGLTPIFPLSPPLVAVEHYRFLGHPHVLAGHRLCLYLDPQREWHPDSAPLRLVNRLWDWFTDAAAGKFDASLALYHPVGGVLHETPGTPVVVVRDDFPDVGPLSNAYLVPRTGQRLDLTWSAPDAEGIFTARVIRLRDPLYYSAGTTLKDLLEVVARPRRETAAAMALHRGWPHADTVLTALARTAQRSADGTPVYFVVGVPHTATNVHHLLTGRLTPAVSDALRSAAARGGPIHVIDPSDLLRDAPVEWCAMSDERPQISIRRDENRPVHALHGKCVHVWGCGGIGSWVAEFVARAGAAEITLCDTGRVAGGLLVRQNYVEDDIGKNKADALGARLRSISDTLTVHTHADHALKQATEEWQNADVLIDATVNTTVAHLLDKLFSEGAKKPVVAQMATDVRTGTFGIMSVVTPQHPSGLSRVDQAAGRRVQGDTSLERFQVFWREPVAGDELVPARGCSVPTFHGSSADLAAVAASLVSLLALHVGSEQSGTHLIALPARRRRRSRPQLHPDRMTATAPSADRRLRNLIHGALRRTPVALCVPGQGRPSSPCYPRNREVSRGKGVIPPSFAVQPERWDDPGSRSSGPGAELTPCACRAMGRDLVPPHRLSSSRDAVR